MPPITHPTVGKLFHFIGASQDANNTVGGAGLVGRFFFFFGAACLFKTFTYKLG
jgi:hypothetical protein